MKSSLAGKSLLLTTAALALAGWGQAQRPQEVNPASTAAAARSCMLASERPVPPRQVRVGAVRYSIELVAQVAPAGTVTGLSGKICDARAVRHGWCDAPNRIYIKSGRTLRQERISVLHEIQHAMLGTEKSEEETSYHEFIYELSPRLLEVLQQNPELYSYLTTPDPCEEQGPALAGTPRPSGS